MVENFDENEEYNSDPEAAKKAVKKKKKKKPRKSSTKKESKKKKKKRRGNDLTSHRYLYCVLEAFNGSAQFDVLMHACSNQFQYNVPLYYYLFQILVTCLLCIDVDFVITHYVYYFQ